MIQNSTKDIIEGQNAGTRAILDFLTQDKIASLQAENQSLKFQASQTAQNAYITASQDAQTAELIRRLGVDCPQPAYVVQPPQPVTFPNGWIPVQGRLPEDNHKGIYDMQLVTLEDGEVCMGVYNNREKEWWTRKQEGERWYTNKHNVIAWQPLPEPYKEEKKC